MDYRSYRIADRASEEIPARIFKTITKITPRRNAEVIPKNAKGIAEVAI